MPAERLRDAAAAYLHNADNRGIYERSEYFAEVAGADEADAALEYLISDAFQSEADAALAAIAPAWEDAGMTAPRRILDAGSGPGVTTLAMARRYPDAAVIGIDVERHALDFARALAAETPQCTFAETPIESFAPGEGFDLIQCREVIEHVFDPPEAVAQIGRLLRPGGVAYVEFPNYLFPWEPHVRLPMLPKSPKWLLALQCRAFGRDPQFVYHLNFECDPVTFKRWVRSAPVALEHTDLMAEKIRAVFEGHLDSAVPARTRLVRRLSRRPRLREACIHALTVLPVAPSVAALLRRPTS